MIARRMFIGAGMVGIATSSAVLGQAPTDSLSIRANAFRLAAARSASTAVSDRGVSPKAARSLRLPGVGVPLIDGFHRYLFSAATTIYGHRPAKSAVVGYYAPLLDSWWVALLSEGTFIADGRLTLAPLFGSELLAQNNLTEIRTYGAIETIRQRIGSAIGNFRAEFASEARGEPRAFERIATSEQGATLFRDRVVELAATLDRFAKDEGAFLVLDTVLADLASGTMVPRAAMSDLAFQSFAELAAQDFGSRGDFLPVLAIENADWWLVVSASAMLGSKLLFTEIERSSRSAVTRMAIIDLNR